LLDRFRYLFLTSNAGMPVNVRGHTGFRVAGSPLDSIDQCAHFQKQSDGSVPKIVESDTGQSRTFQDLLEFMLDAVVVPKGADARGVRPIEPWMPRPV
jgi:hypothetical protein